MSTATKARKARNAKLTPRLSDQCLLTELQLLDEKYAQIRELQSECRLLHSDLVEELQARKLQIFYLDREQSRRAELVVPRVKTIPIDAFAAACAANEIDVDEAESAIKPASVLLGQAKKLLDEDVLKAITQETPGRPKIIFVDNTSQAVADDEESEA